MPAGSPGGGSRMTERLADIGARIGGIRQLGAVVNAMRGIAAARAQQARSQTRGRGQLRGDDRGRDRPGARAGPRPPPELT